MTLPALTGQGFERKLNIFLIDVITSCFTGD